MEQSPQHIFKLLNIQNAAGTLSVPWWYTV